MAPPLICLPLNQPLLLQHQHLLQQFGMPGLSPGGLDHPNGVAPTRDGTIYVTTGADHVFAVDGGSGSRSM